MSQNNKNKENIRLPGLYIQGTWDTHMAWIKKLTISLFVIWSFVIFFTWFSTGDSRAHMAHIGGELGVILLIIELVSILGYFIAQIRRSDEKWTITINEPDDAINSEISSIFIDDIEEKNDEYI